MRVLVTGGAGFVGANLCHRLLADEAIASVRVIDDLSTGSLENLSGLRVELTVGSILDQDLLFRAASGVDAIVHLAAVPSVPRSIADPVTTHEANATGTLRVLEAARAQGDVHVILASSSSVYGSNPVLPKTEDLQLRPMSPYAVSKLATEQYAMAYSACYELPVLPFRFFNVFGPLQSAGHAYAAVIPAWFDAALRRQPLMVNGDGQQSRDFTSVNTVSDVIARALVHRVTSTPMNLAFGSRTTLLELADLIEDVVGQPIERRHREPRAGDVPHSQASSELVREAFPDVEPADLREELERTFAWLRERPEYR